MPCNDPTPSSPDAASAAWRASMRAELEAHAAAAGPSSRLRLLYARAKGDRSKTGDPKCTEAASKLASRKATSEDHRTLAECRAKTRTARKATLEHEAGHEGKAQHLAHRAKSQGPVSAKARAARAEELKDARRPAPPPSAEPSKRIIKLKRNPMTPGRAPAAGPEAPAAASAAGKEPPTWGEKIGAPFTPFHNNTPRAPIDHDLVGHHEHYNFGASNEYVAYTIANRNLRQARRKAEAAAEAFGADSPQARKFAAERDAAQARFDEVSAPGYTAPEAEKTADVIARLKGAKDGASSGGPAPMPSPPASPPSDRLADLAGERMTTAPPVNPVSRDRFHVAFTALRPLGREPVPVADLHEKLNGMSRAEVDDLVRHFAATGRYDVDPAAGTVARPEAPARSTPRPGVPADLRGHVLEVAARLRSEGKGDKMGHVPIHLIRSEVRKELGNPPSDPRANDEENHDDAVRAAARVARTSFDDDFQRAVFDLDREDHARMVSIGNRARLSHDELQDSLPGVQETFTSLGSGKVEPPAHYFTPRGDSPIPAASRRLADLAGKPGTEASAKPKATRTPKPPAAPKPPKAVTPEKARAKVIEAMGAPGGMPLSTVELRQKTGLDKPSFDDAVNDLLESGHLNGHRHDFVQSLDDEDRAKLVPARHAGNDPQRTHFVILTRPRGATSGAATPASPSPSKRLDALAEKPAPSKAKTSAPSPAPASKPKTARAVKPEVAPAPATVSPAPPSTSGHLGAIKAALPKVFGNQEVDDRGLLLSTVARHAGLTPHQVVAALHPYVRTHDVDFDSPTQSALDAADPEHLAQLPPHPDTGRPVDVVRFYRPHRLEPR